MENNQKAYIPDKIYFDCPEILRLSDNSGVPDGEDVVT